MTSAIIGLIGAAIGYWVSELRHRREMAVKMIEIALGILTAKPEPENKALREWAVDILALNSPAPLSAGAKQAMLSRPLPYSSATFDFATAAKTILNLGKNPSA